MKTTKTIILLTLAAFSLFLAISLSRLDPDFGFQLKMGELIATQGIPETDPFSYTMPSHPVVSHEWLLTVLVYYVHEKFGMLGLSAIFSIVAVLAALLACLPGLTSKKRETRLFAAFLFGVVCVVLSDFMGVRMQVFSWLYMTLLYTLISRATGNKKIWLLLPMLLLLWANTHGTFVLGLGITGIFLFVKWLRLKKIDGLELLSFSLAFLATFVNPYITGHWWEVWNTFTDTSLKWRILEWMPALVYLNLTFIFFVALSATLVWKYRRGMEAEYLAVYVVLVWFLITSLRNAPLFLIFATPITIKTFIAFLVSVKSSVAKYRFVKLGRLVLAIVVVISITHVYMYDRKARLLYVYPSDQAIEHLRLNVPEGNVYSMYMWGGYLIWKYPEKKVFIDGRMPSWKGYGSMGEEPVDIMGYYLQIMDGKIDFNNVSDRYAIDVALLPVDNKHRGQGVYLFFKTNNDWIKVYEDQTAVIYQLKDEGLRTSRQ